MFQTHNLFDDIQEALTCESPPTIENQFIIPSEVSSFDVTDYVSFIYLLRQEFFLIVPFSNQSMLFSEPCLP